MIGVLRQAFPLQSHAASQEQQGIETPGLRSLQQHHPTGHVKPSLPELGAQCLIGAAVVHEHRRTRAPVSLRHPGHRRIDAVTQLLALVMALLLPLWTLIAAPAAAQAAEHYLCGGEALIAELHQGAVDAGGIPNSNGGTVPGAFLVLQWRGVSLQLPRTNNAGTPSYSDGRWWWQALDPDHPEFAQRRGEWESYSCERTP